MGFQVLKFSGFFSGLIWFLGLRNLWKPKCLITDECANPELSLGSHCSVDVK